MLGRGWGRVDKQEVAERHEGLVPTEYGIQWYNRGRENFQGQLVQCPVVVPIPKHNHNHNHNHKYTASTPTVAGDGSTGTNASITVAISITSCTIHTVHPIIGGWELSMNFKALEPRPLRMIASD